jgi:dTDP-4-amino-4,6-dideoxygalactose transaminase
VTGIQRTLPLVDIAAIHRELGTELEAGVLAAVRRGQFAGGPGVSAFEQAFADYLGCAEAVGLSNGTDALELAVRALALSPGAEVLMPANTFIATAEAVVCAAAVPVFVDVDPDSGLSDLDGAADQVSSRTELIIPVHLYGRMVDMDAVRAFAQRHRLAVVEDAAQAHGAARNGRRAGTAGEIGCFSFYPGKNLGAFGEAGAAVTGDPALAERLRVMRDHGQRGRYNHEMLGFNCRMDPIQAAVLSVKPPHLDEWYERRRRAGVQTGIHYPQPVPRTPPFARTGAFPVAEHGARHQLSLPMHPHLQREDVEQVAALIAGVSSARPELAPQRAAGSPS